MSEVVWLVPLFPLVGFVSILLFGRKLGEPRSGHLATAMVLASFVVSVGLFFDLLGKSEEDRAHVETLLRGCPSSRCRSTWRSSSTRCR